MFQIVFKLVFQILVVVSLRNLRYSPTCYRYPAQQNLRRQKVSGHTVGLQVEIHLTVAGLVAAFAFAALAGEGPSLLYAVVFFSQTVLFPSFLLAFFLITLPSLR